MNDGESQRIQSQIYMLTSRSNSKLRNSGQKEPLANIILRLLKLQTIWIRIWIHSRRLIDRTLELRLTKLLDREIDRKSRHNVLSFIEDFLPPPVSQ